MDNFLVNTFYNRIAVFIFMFNLFERVFLLLINNDIHAGCIEIQLFKLCNHIAKKSKLACISVYVIKHDWPIVGFESTQYN